MSRSTDSAALCAIKSPGIARGFVFWPRSPGAGDRESYFTDTNGTAEPGTIVVGSTPFRRSAYGYVMQSKLPAALLNLVYLRVSQINNCACCLDMHTRDLLKQGQKIEKLALLQAWVEAGDLFDKRERAALAWAETVTRVADTGVPDEAHQAARAVFEEREPVDLTLAISLMNAYNRMAMSFRNMPQAVIDKAAA